MTADFNRNFNEKGEKARFIYKRNPLNAAGFQLFEWKAEKGDYEPVGEYTLIDLSEDIDITEKKVINLIALMNGHSGLIDFKNLTNQRILFNMVPETADKSVQKIVFRVYDGTGVSKDNAVLTIEKGVFDDQSS